jgi:hypothetical protein
MSSQMDTGIQNQTGVVTAGSCFLVAPEIKGVWQVGPVTDGHAVVEYGFAVSKALVPGKGDDLQSARALGSLFTMTLLKQPQESFVQANQKKTNFAKMTILNLKNHGVTADETFRIELTNVTIVEVRTNRKRQIGGYSQNPTALAIHKDRGMGHALDADPNHFAQQNDPNAVRQSVDTLEMDCCYDTMTIIHTAMKESGEVSGKTPASYSWTSNAAVPAS